MAGGALDYVVRMQWRDRAISHYGPYNLASAERVARLCNRIAESNHHENQAEVVELERFIDPSPGVDERVTCRHCGQPDP